MAQVDPGDDLAEKQGREYQRCGDTAQAQPVAQPQDRVGKQGQVQEQCHQQEFQACSHCHSILSGSAPVGFFVPGDDFFSVLPMV